MTSKICSILYTVPGLSLISVGLGIPIAFVPPDEREQFMKTLWALYFPFAAAACLARASVLLFYSRVFTNQSRVFRHAIYITHGINVAWLLSIWLAALLICRPIEQFWVSDGTGTCGSNSMLLVGCSITNILVDLIILMIPLPVLWKLQLKLGKKLLISAVFTCGYW